MMAYRLQGDARTPTRKLVILHRGQPRSPSTPQRSAGSAINVPLLEASQNDAYNRPERTIDWFTMVCNDQAIQTWKFLRRSSGFVQEVNEWPASP
jgi:hypothetical protein